MGGALQIIMCIDKASSSMQKAFGFECFAAVENEETIKCCSKANEIYCPVVINVTRCAKGHALRWWGRQPGAGHFTSACYVWFVWRRCACVCMCVCGVAWLPRKSWHFPRLANSWQQVNASQKVAGRSLLNNEARLMIFNGWTWAQVGQIKLFVIIEKEVYFMILSS